MLEANCCGFKSVASEAEVPRRGKSSCELVVQEWLRMLLSLRALGPVSYETAITAGRAARLMTVVQIGLASCSRCAWCVGLLFLVSLET